ncbi:FAD-dependent oxidoreductase [Candidatus Poribacteria bacterium]|nr:FAD-dependent oxidoreductase [Candidatus Poribacteria bacterium]MBT5533610.1 FAD-dependent oxidoreductase [Candidatus Poribacteria bacterium]MBT5712358.1 FAD-dependent oxidoreductase [Candidatus Poribacteria bacterium]MBT7807041.1 FAD-dependent oxidoreductase [Candidatus Poribacteria bacterium]
MERHECDVLVAGGGMAGIAAAVASARSGAETTLIDNAGWLGGMGITGATGLHSFFNVFDAVPGAARTRVVGGIAQELVDRVAARGGGIGHVRMERGGDFVSMLTPVEPEVFKVVAAEMCREVGVNLLLHTTLHGVDADAGRIVAARLWNKAGAHEITAAVYIDCTGDGDLAAYAGAPHTTFAAGEHGAYSAGFTFRLCNVDLAALEADLDARGLVSQLAHAVKPGMSTPDLVRLGINMRKLRDEGVSEAPGYFLSSSLRPRELTYCNCINHGPNDGLDPAALTNAELDLRQRMLSVAEMFREQFAGCEQCYAAGPAPTAGQRRGRAIHCDYELSQDDCTGGRQFHDQIACFGFIDNGRHFVEDAGAYGVPYRALVPQGLDNALIAGRMMTVDLVAHNSTRNTACCLAGGEAAGTAAAVAAADDTTPREVDVEALRNTLRANGAILEPVPDPL